MFPASRILIPKYLLEMSCNFLCILLFNESKLFATLQGTIILDVEWFCAKFERHILKVEKIPQAKGLLYLVTPLPHSYRGKKSLHTYLKFR